MTAVYFNVPSVVAPCGDIFLTPDNKQIYTIGKHNTAIHQTDLDVKNKPKPRLIYTTSGNPKALMEIPGAIHGPYYGVDCVWKDAATGRVCFITCPDKLHASACRFKEDQQSLDTLDVADEVRGSPFALSDGTPALWESNYSTKENKIHIMQLHGTKVEIAETIILPNVAFSFSRPRSDRYSSVSCAFDRAPDGTCYALASEARLYQRLPGETTWKHIAGVGGYVQHPAHTDGPPLTLQLGQWMSMSAGPNGDVILCDSQRDRNFYLTKDGKSSFYFNHRCYVTRVVSVRWSYVDPAFCYLASEKAVFKVAVPEEQVTRAKAAAEILPLSSLFHSHPELSDSFISLKDGSKIQLHRCILSVRCPKLLAWIENGHDLTDAVLKTIFKYIYDGEVPSDVRHEILPMDWIPLGRAAAAISLDLLAARCQTAFGRALFYADPEVCLSTLVFVAKRKEDAAYLAVAKSVILDRYEVLIDRAHLLSEFPNVLVWFTNHLSTKLKESEAMYMRMNKNSLQDLGLDQVPDDSVERKRYAADMASLFNKGEMTDMVLGNVPCHRAVLIPRCEFVAMALSSGFAEQSSYVIKLSDDRITEAVVRRLLRYLYTMSATSDILGEDPDELADILELADFMQLHSHAHLIDYCETRVRVAESQLPKAVKPKKRTRANPEPDNSAQSILLTAETEVQAPHGGADEAEEAKPLVEDRPPKRRKR